MQSKYQELSTKLTQMKVPSPDYLQTVVDLVVSGWNINPEQALGLADIALPTLRQQTAYQELARILVFVPKIYLERGEFNLALNLIDEGIEASEQSKQERLKADNLINKAYVYKAMGKTVMANAILEETLQLYKKQGINKLIGQNLNELGQVAKLNGDLLSALDFYRDALNYLEDDASSQEYGVALTNIGEVYTELGDYKTAEQYILRGALLLQDSQKSAQLIETYRKLAHNALGQQDYEQALQHIEKAFNVMDSTSQGYRKTKLYVPYSQALLNLQRFEKLKNILDKALTMALEHGLDNEAIEIYFVYVDYYLAIEDVDQAATVLQTVLDFSSLHRLAQHKLFALRKLANVQSGLGQHELALKTFRQYHDDYMAWLQDQKSNKLIEYQAIFQSHERERRITDLENENMQHQLAHAKTQQEKHNWMLLLAVVLLTVCFIVIRFYQKRKFFNMKASLMADMVKRKNQMLADVSHELRTPLTALKLTVEALQYKLLDDVDEAYRSLDRKINDMNNLIGDIYQLAQSDIDSLQLNRRYHHFPSLLAGWQSELREYVLSQGFDWQFNNLLSANFSVDLDNEKIKQVLNNLIANSCHYTDKPGVIRLTVSNRNRNVRLVIEDSAPGVPSQDLERIFERLYRVESSRSRQTGGSGLGLAICKSIIEGHGGNIKAESSELGGLKITINFRVIVVEEQ
ncbi:ATP-binding protein [Saccharobesus litoralis]|nr:ATP-binding protein [Saccharobesus litoralis]